MTSGEGPYREASDWSSVPAGDWWPPTTVHVSAWRPPSRRMIIISVALLLMTLVTTLLVGALHMGVFLQLEWWQGNASDLEKILYLFKHPFLLLRLGLPYAGALMLILLSHELGHYMACIRYGVDATLPFFLPAPTIIGTFGAFIRIRSVIPDRRALFDIGLAGPLTGFLVSLPFLAYGIAMSRPAVEVPQQGMLIFFGEPLLWRFLSWIFWPQAPASGLFVHPVGLAAWFGLLATNLNLFPIGQLDGGHITYALFGRRARWVGMVFWGGLVVLVLHNWVWALWTLLTFFIGFRHPPTLYDEPLVSPSRRRWGVVAALIFLLTFMPDPIRVSSLTGG